MKDRTIDWRQWALWAIRDMRYQHQHAIDNATAVHHLKAKVQADAIRLDLARTTLSNLSAIPEALETLNLIFDGAAPMTTPEEVRAIEIENALAVERGRILDKLEKMRNAKEIDDEEMLVLSAVVLIDDRPLTADDIAWAGQQVARNEANQNGYLDRLKGGTVAD